MGQKQVARFVRRITADMFEEIEDSPEEAVQSYLKTFGKLIVWSGTGNDEDLPPELKSWLFPQKELIAQAPRGIDTELSGSDTSTG